MHHKATNEFQTGNGNHFSLFGFIIPDMKRNSLFIDGNDSGISDGNAIGIAPEVFDSISVSVEGFLDFGIPVYGIKLVLEFVPCIMVAKFLA